jgi:hypothetical protein
VGFDDLVDRHGVSRFGEAVEPIALPTDGSLIDYFRAARVSARKASPRSNSYFEVGAPTADAIKDACSEGSSL